MHEAKKKKQEGEIPTMRQAFMRVEASLTLQLHELRRVYQEWQAEKTMADVEPPRPDS